ncbi:conserved hypothetical protein [Streptomyces viridochromogenes DSM 40736]|uniref:Uncharacterized protein n=1 Tax=Streptomyces viridochromogenes (strain DSM 40736 / JCM 4977 / BCRC 1201 / Tue 494) TaxID=591159 RepID=D9XDG5_STRVT|nr:hypothetical protein [Streptomyces viridochromogenes]EFL30344.1 conserved hypothetical protein [Streptomyces viridochromogenes DSM 40736]
MSSGGITWIADGDISWLGYCIKLARGLTGEQLAARLAAPGAPVPVRATTGPQAESLVDELDAEHGDADGIAVRYGDHAGLGFALAYGHWPSVLGPAYHDGTSRDGVHVFELYYEKQNPKVPPPAFAYFHDDHYVCGFDMYMHTWSQEITGPGADLVRADIVAAGIPEETERDTAHRASLAVLEQRFELALPRDLILDAPLPTALVRGQQPR